MIFLGLFRVNEIDQLGVRVSLFGSGESMRGNFRIVSFLSIVFYLEIICIISKGHQLGQITCFEIERMSQERVVVRTHLNKLKQNLNCQNTSPFLGFILTNFLL